MHDVVIIGGGPSGLTSGLYARRARLNTLLIENLSIQSQATVTASIENYPGFPDGISGPDLIERLKKQVLQLGLEIIEGNVKSVKSPINKTWLVSTEENNTIETISLIVASGARPKQLNVKGEREFIGKGISYCAVCDGAFFKDKDIIVVGGGDAAAEETLFLTKFVRNIKLIHRRDKLRAVKMLQEKILNNKKIEIIWDSTIKEIIGKNKVEGVNIINIKTKKEINIPCDGVFIFVGYTPNTDFIKGLLDMDSDGYIITDDNMKTSKDGIYSCGDCRHKSLRQIITACGDGAVAAFSAQQYVEQIKYYDKS